ncbi:MaoC/PaaZ C-terminal domain-containing protein [Intestinimonas sp.]|uniref:MaoC/PaaZ C-terminal domain-containing protein n=1 Tax=Intestinimonas sp. TaxID=1965293 RepID=UPI003AB03D9D
MSYLYNPKGFYLEDYEIGREYTSQGRTITEADVVNFAGVSGDFNPLHTDEEFGKANQFGKRIAHGALGFIISTGLNNQMGIAEGTTIAFIECTVKYTAPLLIGDTVHIVVIPTEVIHSSKPGKGILKQLVKLVNQDERVIMESNQTLMVKSRV